MPTAARMNKLKGVAAQRQAGLTVVIEDVFDPHNLGAITRSCDAFGIQEINIIFDTHPEFDPKEVGKNSSTATNKWLNYRVRHGSEKALRALKEEGWHIVATALDPNAESIFEADLSQPKLALLFGNEKDGLSARALRSADRLVTIPMRGIAQSMNVSVTAAVFLYEVTRQRRQKHPGAYAADEAAQQKTLDYFLEMHRHLNRRNKAQRQKRANERLSPANE
ncbi:MAG: RNA methyltransferase [Chloroflexota bacterium]|nr:RNA methyltransferase [Chloroflexota bacterium]